jgi:spermidine synthase
LQANKRSKPLSYYREGTGVALAITQLRQAKQKDTLLAAQLSAHSGNLNSLDDTEQQNSLLNHGLNVGLIGLGAGTLAAYGEPGDSFTFYELNPAVIKVAKEYFSYLEDSQAEVEIIQGDARVSIAKQSMNHTFNDYDLLVLDAFSGDSIPQHLLTTQAIELYLKQLSPEGAIVVHVSNSHLDLLGLMAGLAKHFKLAHQYFYIKAETESGHDSQWVLLTNNKVLIKSPTLNAHKSSWPNTKKTLVWTDEYSSLLSVLK